jgi:LysM repeat protein
MKTKFLALALIVVLASVFLLASVPASAAPTASNIVHVVQAGENLFRISLRYGVNMWTIASANGITNPNRIYVGQRLIIPVAAPTGTVHVVRYGETLTGIAVRYGVDAWAIAGANNISNLNNIYVGQRLIIPGVSPSPQTPSTPPSQPTQWPGPWQGEYFDNISLTAPAFVVRTDSQLNFDWAYGPPAGGMPTNNFSARWTGTFPFNAGTYRFYVRVDDGMRVYLDGVLLMNGWQDGVLRTYVATRSLTAGDHTFKIEYYDRTQVARIHFWYVQLSGDSSVPTPTPTPGPSPSSPTASWYAQFYNGQDLSGTPVATRYDGAIGFEWGANSPAAGVWSDHFSARWTGTFPFKADHYRFCAMSDDGVRIYVDNQSVLDEWHANNSVAYCGTQYVDLGNHEVKVEYYEDGGNALLYVWWEPQ